LRVVETLSLANKQTLALVKVDGQDFLIGTNATSLAVLAMMDPNQGGQVSLADAQQLAASFYSKVQ
jgi:flagellar biogenesis protein FliO